MPAKLTFQQFLERAYKAQGHRYTYDHVDFKNTTTKVAVTCPKHGDFMITPKNLFKGRGCPACNKVVPNTTKSFIEKARKVHGDKYDYSKVNFTRNRDKVTIICPKHGPFEQEANSHLQGHGCPKCYAERITGLKHPERYAKAQETFMKKYGVSNPMKLASIREKGYKTKRMHHSFNTSKQEEMLYQMLVDAFGKSNVKRQYVSSLRYPSHCDFYISSRDMFIELNASWTHCNHWYRNDAHDKAIVSEWRDEHSLYYDRAIKTWVSYDVIKRKTAKRNKLNYVVFWDQYLRDAKMWIAMGTPDGHDYDHEFSWLPNLNLLPTLHKYKRLSQRTMSQIVKNNQFYVFYHHEIEMWNNPDALYQEYPLKGFLFMNRFQYLHKIPQEVTAKNILSAFAITGIYRGYSSYDVTLFERVIEDYSIKCIYDPFAGWGERSLAALNYCVPYFGIDINSSLSEGYQLLNNHFDLQKRNISFTVGDARKYKLPAKDYSVITCPPYFDIEKYSKEGMENDSYSQFMDDWNIVVSNCQNAPYFCFQINQKYKKNMSKVVLKHGFTLVDTLNYGSKRASHLQYKNGKCTKKEFEEMLVFKNNNL